jgi:hypothetical protein
VKKLKSEASLRVADIMRYYDNLTKKAVSSDGKEIEDTSMYTGSAGVIYGLYRYSLYLAKEQKEI